MNPSRAPKRLYWLELEPNQPRLPYGAKGGGKFTDLRAAEMRKGWLAARHGIESTIFQTQELEWEAVND